MVDRRQSESVFFCSRLMVAFIVMCSTIWFIRALEIISIMSLKEQEKKEKFNVQFRESSLVYHFNDKL